MNNIDINSPEYQSLFIEEMKELIDLIENDIISFEVQADKDIKDRIKRSLHTLKGNFKIYGNEEYVDNVHIIETEFEEKEEKVISDILSFISKIREEYGIEENSVEEEIINTGDEEYKIIIDFQGKTFSEFDIENLLKMLGITGNLKNIEYMDDMIPDFENYDPLKLFLKIYIEIENTKKEYIDEVLLKYIESKYYKLVGKRKNKEI